MGAWIKCCCKVKDLSVFVAYNEESVKLHEHHIRDGKEIHGAYVAHVISQKRLFYSEKYLLYHHNAAFMHVFTEPSSA